MNLDLGPDQPAEKETEEQTVGHADEQSRKSGRNGSLEGRGHGLGDMASERRYKPCKCKEQIRPILPAGWQRGAVSPGIAA